MKVPTGGSNCAKCTYVKGENDTQCGNEYFVEWNDDSTELPAAADEYCCDFFEAKSKNKPQAIGERLKQQRAKKG